MTRFINSESSEEQHFLAGESRESILSDGASSVPPCLQRSGW
jgi:hypothetical protein